MMNQFSLDLFDLEKIDNQKYPEIVTFPSGAPMPDGEVIIYQNFFEELESNQLFKELESGISWQQDRIKMFGKEFNLPRLTAWYGDQGKSYTYSGITMAPTPWNPVLLLIKARIEKVVSLEFNSVLANLYRHGQDHMSWHSDDERELGKNPIIASVSFGETRRFLLRHKYDRELEKLEVSLNNGSLLIMQGSTQHFWKHQIPKTAKKINPRINLTFRFIK
ncbi:alkylated DNA repair protein [Xenococcus sp. PCC 7305]|uniref:alpha-ketoglutarate-dependent dioxygenase AlkB family protein n=1 Tax=Xenococcus sp. PCC 7305 TaxID=102125 RepID=UPI0002AD0C1F|nr:alpha-ketoglutarate-dependent dioxygenase AlkB [Xenococcus sp. PCC 7305]ELS03428.1 alkylated DNA repair protein [Xenococcus sp. PCC 7305]